MMRALSRLRIRMQGDKKAILHQDGLSPEIFFRRSLAPGAGCYVT